MKNILNIALCLLTAFISIACNQDKAQQQKPEEDKEAKRMLQGVWLNSDDETLTMMVKGDSIFYADSTSAAVSFAVISDSLVLRGSVEMRYQILKQTENIFVFKNTSNDTIRLEKTTEEFTKSDFNTKPSVITFNQGETVDSDTTMTAEGRIYKTHVQVTPTNIKVNKNTYNSDGVGVDNVYYDNIVNVKLVVDGRVILHKNFTKDMFRKFIPKEFIKQTILSDIFVNSVDDKGVHCIASVCLPDTQISYDVPLVITRFGKYSIGD